MTDPLQIMADLKPAGLDQMTQEAYERRRAIDLARAFADAGGSVPRSTLARRQRVPGWPLLTGGGVLGAAAAVTAIALTGALTGPPASPVHPGSGTEATSGSPVLDARTFLLASADIARNTPATTGGYWYVKERDFEPTWPAAKGQGAAVPKSKQAAKPAPATGPGFGAYYAATEESWTGQDKARTIVNENLQFGFASAADEARWVAAGKPKLFNPAGGFGYSGTRTSDYGITLYFGYGVHRLSVNDARKLPGTQDALARLLTLMWNSEPDKQAAVGSANPTFGQYVFTWAGALLGGPATQATKAALYRLLAAQPGITAVPGVTDPRGRTGVAVGDGTGNYLLIDPRTASLLATTTAPVHAGGKIPAASGGTEAIIAEGWASGLGVLPR